MGLAGRAQGSRRGRCRRASSTTSNAEIARNPRAPFGFRRHGGICVVGAHRSQRPAARSLSISWHAISLSLT